MALKPEILKTMLRSAATAHDHEACCKDCFDELDCYVELSLAGLSPEEAMPLVHEHLSTCSACREEYEALLDALRALQEQAEDSTD